MKGRKCHSFSSWIQSAQIPSQHTAPQVMSSWAKCQRSLGTNHGGEISLDSTIARQKGSVSLVLVNISFNSCYGCTLPERVRVQFEVLKEQVVAIAGEGEELHTYLVCLLCPFLDWETQFTVIHDLVTSHLDDYNVLYVGLPLKSIEKLQLVQNVAACTILGSQFVHAV